VANPAYVVSLVTGLLLVYYGNYSFLESRWIFYAAILFSVMGTLAFGFYSPVLSKLIKTLKATGSNTEEYRRLERKQKWLGAVLLMMAMSVVLLMIIKPA
jgi:nitrogen fixation/metabolism regulation signal transduction histidine kinase